jgi:prepilin-type N-terminal cleavage/methylation domain-containing protein
MPRDAKGYTFIELTVVVVLIGLMMAVTMPRFRYTLLTDDLKTATRKLVGIIKSIRSEAIRDQKGLFLHFDLEANRFWLETADMEETERLTAREKAPVLPAGIRFVDVWLKGEGKKVGGETAIRFYKQGYVQPAAIHLASEDGREWTLVLSPFLGRVEVLEKYVDFEDV